MTQIYFTQNADLESEECTNLTSFRNNSFAASGILSEFIVLSKRRHFYVMHNGIWIRIYGYINTFSVSLGKMYTFVWLKIIII